jgi:hypothetical protein
MLICVKHYDLPVFKDVVSQGKYRWIILAPRQILLNGGVMYRRATDRKHTVFSIHFKYLSKEDFLKSAHIG